MLQRREWSPGTPILKRTAHCDFVIYIHYSKLIRKVILSTYVICMEF